MPASISVIVPLYNEQAVFSKLVSRLDALASETSESLEFLLVDDGSDDSTPILMRRLALANSNYTCIFLSRNYGHQIAVSAGMECASGSEAIMVIDGDLQDPPELMIPFYTKLKEGYDVVYAVRRKRKEGMFKRMAYWLFYRFLKSISETPISLDSGDFCMMTRNVNDILVSMPEKSRFIRGMRTWIGFKQFGYAYERDQRASGEPKYKFKTLVKLAYDGIFNFSYAPLRLITKIGLASILPSIAYLGYIFYKKIVGLPMPSGFTALISAIVLFSGVQLICLGIIGEYLARIYVQVKGRPLFIIKDRIVNKEQKNG